MIYTLTLNPSIDCFIIADKITGGTVNRIADEQIYIGGKGINVSLMLKELGIESTALGFSAGYIGKALENGLKSNDIKCDFVHTKSGNTRINVKINDTDINAAGPYISRNMLNRLYKKINNIHDGDFLIISGSIPSSVPDDIYKILLEKLKNKNIRLVVDCEKDLLLNTLEFKPFLIKPNNNELSDIFETQINDFESALFYARKLQTMGAKNVMVSLGDKGAILLDEFGEAHIEKAPQGELVSAVGSGDSAVAAFVAAICDKKTYAEALKFSVAVGSATAFSNGLASKYEIEKTYSIMNKMY